uniref:BZIP domain-containing protein n=1 Tax=Odontella aurita TaxID=265563 RepID=A0A7S4K4A3_9STRA|mmetsp:Transcript_61370/g.181440  ORF Transcript_61370/g.181440 Transcript_61370/m.181440 type:complete len:468 (+) Transcript_61370:179-1582(+)
MNPYLTVHQGAMVAMMVGGQEIIFPKPTAPVVEVEGNRQLLLPQLVNVVHGAATDVITFANTAATSNGDEQQAQAQAETEAEAEAGEPPEDAEDRLTRSRERNREHARRTRLRKKAQLRALQDRIKELQEEGRILRQTVEECSIASILLGLSSGSGCGGSCSEDEGAATQQQGDGPATRASSASEPGAATAAMNFDPTAGATGTGGKRKRFLLDSSDHAPRPMKLRIRGQLTVIGGDGTDGNRAHINWKTGVYCDEDGVHRQLSSEELETLRRERNRMHAKMTRDRKKSFISAVERTIHELERENSRMRDILAKQARRHFPAAASGGGAVSDAKATKTVGVNVNAASVTPDSTPLFAAAKAPSPGCVSPAEITVQEQVQQQQQPPQPLLPMPAVPAMGAIRVGADIGVPPPPLSQRRYRPLTVAPAMPLASAQLSGAPASVSLGEALSQATKIPPLPTAIHGFSVMG